MSVYLHAMHAVHVPCSSSTDTIRLTQYSSDTIGRLEVCSGDKWGTVCGEGATLNTIATVACRELNHAAIGIDAIIIIIVAKHVLLCRRSICGRKF